MSGRHTRGDWVAEGSDCRVTVEEGGVRVMLVELGLCFISPNAEYCIIKFKDISLM